MVKTPSVAAFILNAFFIQKLGAQSPPPDLVPVPDPPTIPDQVRSGETLEPEVTIIRRARETITEYRLNGRLQAIRVEPENAPAYYLVDTDGDGDLETRRNAYGPDFLIPQWVIFSW
ncbi:MAG: DUF2782 domain-containing protein [Gammaproteobacteria bacterium]|nr:DUF2782 domain-containing protein [Gammaproteobacteria bacterium]